MKPVRGIETFDNLIKAAIALCFQLNETRSRD